MRDWLRSAGIYVGLPTAGIYLSLLAAMIPFQPTLAESNASPFTASYFVAADKEDTVDFSTNMATAPGSPLAIRVNKTPVSHGNYAGVEICAPTPDVNFQNVSFLLAGSEATQVLVHSQAKNTNFLNYRGTIAKNGMKFGKAVDGYVKVSIDAAQMNIAPGDAVDKIVISTNENDSKASFTIKDISIDGKLVSKSVQNGARFYPVVNGKSSGPKENLTQVVKGLPTTPATASVLNSSGAIQYFYITLLLPSKTTTGYPTNEEIKNLSNVLTSTSGPNVVSGEGTITKIDAKHGYFFLNTGDTVSFTTNPSNHTFSAQIFTNGTNPNSSMWPDNGQCITNVNAANQPIQGAGRGATFAEITLNVDTNYLLGDSADISEVNGVNAIYKITFPPLPAHAATTNYNAFFCTSNYLFAKNQVYKGSAFQKGQFIPVQSIQNRPGSSFTGDATAPLLPVSPAETVPKGTVYTHGTPGVYPFGCDLCTTSSKPGCPPYSSIVGEKFAICQLIRPVANYGGNLTIELVTFPYPAPTSEPLVRLE